MAKICAHGQIVGTLEYITHAKRYMSDGVILKNHGNGWKLAGKVKQHATPQEAYDRGAAGLAEQLANKPHAAAYRKALFDMAGLSKRWKIHTAIGMMPDDADGVWSEVCDGYGDNVHADLDDVVELCMLYRVMMAAAREPIAA